jgi:3-oxoacyl-[acyl-carrier-protein] synthase II
MTSKHRRVVITGMGIISPVGNTPDALWDAMSAGRSGVGFLRRIPGDHLPSGVGGEASEFRGTIDDFGPLEKQLQRTIKKWMKLMCREIEMGVASAQLALNHAGLTPGSFEPDRIGTLFGCDYIVTDPAEFNRGVMNCLRDGCFDFRLWGEKGLTEIEPLWLLKYLPNMPASHVAIYNDLRGPSNSLTVREASSNLAIAEATTILRRGIADMMVVGATGSRIHPLRSVHVAIQEQLAHGSGNGALSPSKFCRPFDAHRTGMVMGEGAGSLILEDYENAKTRHAAIWGEVIGYGSSTVADLNQVANYRTAIANVIRSCLESANLKAEQVGHVNAHGLGSIRCDQEESQAICDVLGSDLPVVAAKSYMGNLGAGSGIVELVASLQAQRHGVLMTTLNYETPDAKCPIRVVTDRSTEPGDSFININVTPQGQASGVIIRRFE